MFCQPFLIVAQIASPASDVKPDFPDIGMSEICQSATSEIEGGNYYPSLKNAKVSKLHVLAWYREKDDRPLYLDCALVWAEVNTSIGKKWAIVQMARNPMKKEHLNNQHWHSYMVFDGDDGFSFFDAPPRNRDLQKVVYNFKFKPTKGWVRYASHVDQAIWKTLIGDPALAL
jgi:hypothetical protein